MKVLSASQTRIEYLSGQVQKCLVTLPPLCYLQCGSCVAVFSDVLLCSYLVSLRETRFTTSKTELY